jgi:hypothetical protein
MVVGDFPECWQVAETFLVTPQFAGVQVCSWTFLAVDRDVIGASAIGYA